MCSSSAPSAATARAFRLAFRSSPSSSSRSHWKADYEWSIHAGEARKAGLPDDIIAAIEAGRRPAFDDADAELVYDFSTEFFRTERRA